MNKVIIVALLVALFLLFGCVSYGNGTGKAGNGVSTDAGAGGDTVTTTGQTYTINIQNFAFSPAELTIKKGDTVKWINLDSVQHTATSDKEKFDSGLLSQNSSWSRTFNEAGIFEYHCTPHPYMKAKIIVEE